LTQQMQMPPERVAVVAQGVTESFLKSTVNRTQHQRRNRMLYVGQYAYIKAPMVLAAAVSKVFAQRPELKMTWICGRQHHSAVYFLLDQTIRDRVTLKGWTPQAELVQEYLNHGLFLFPSFFEGFGKAPLEAMACEMCVVASQCGGMQDYIQHGKNGWLVPVGDVDALANAIMHLVDHPEQAAQLAHAGRESAKRYSWEHCAEQAVSFYRKLLDAKTSS
jgi:glycosyltransferase involved in cell wall biosynthesis